MPKKTTHVKRAKPQYKRNRKGKRKASKQYYANSKMVMYNAPKRPYPPEYWCCFENVINGVFPVNTLQTTQYQVLLNSLYHPWDAHNLQAAATNFVGVLGYTITAIQPQGYTNLCTSGTDGSEIYAPYNSYTVYQSSIEFEAKPATPSDNLYISIIPTIKPANSALSGIPTNFQAGLPDPYEKRNLLDLTFRADHSNTL